MLRALGHVNYTENHYFRRPPRFPFWSFEYLQTGTISHKDAHGSFQAVGPTFLLRRPNSPYAVTYNASRVAYSEVYAIFIQPPHWNPLLDWPCINESVSEIKVSDPGRLKEIESCLFAACDEWNSFRKNRKMLAMNHVERVLMMIDELNPKHGHQQLDERINRSLEFIQARYREKLNVSNMARIACLSPSRFASLFRQEVGLTPMQQVETLRLGEAADLLVLSRASLEEIAFSVGFETAAHFSIRFKKRFNCSPRRYREVSQIGQKT